MKDKYLQIFEPKQIKELFEKTITDNFVGYSRINGYPIFTI